VELDLGGIAKGHAIDLAARVIRQAGVDRAFVHGGGSSGIGLGEAPAGPWRVALGPERGAPIVELRDQAFSVSTTVERSHIVDPTTGRPVAGPRRAAVVGPSARLADAWTTALVVRGQRDRGPDHRWNVWLDLGSGWISPSAPEAG
jgi:thiamine biosynthesis lipoprotein